MDRLLALVIFLLIPHLSYAGSSTVVYPKWHGLTTATIPSTGSTVKAAGTGAVYDQVNNVFSFSGAAGISAVLPHMADAVGTAITAKAPVTQSLAKQVATGALKMLPGAILTAWALDFGLEYIQGNWQKLDPNAVPGGAVNSPGYGMFASAGAFCSWYNNGTPYTYACGVGQTCGGCNGPGGPGYFYYLGTPTPPASVPATQQDFTDLANTGRDLTPAEMQEMIAAGYAIPIGEPETKIANSPLKAPLIDYDVVLDVNGNPNYIPKDLANLHTDPVTGEKTMPMVSIEPAPNGGVRLSPYEVPYTAQGVPATDAQGNPLPVQQSNPDPCELNPDRAGCAQLGTLDDATPAPTQTLVSITPEAAWGGAGQCPQDVVLNVMGQSVPFKFSGACQFFQLMNPVVLAAAWVSALFIFIGGVRTES